MDNFIVGNGFVLDGVIYELIAKQEFGVVATYTVDYNLLFAYFTIDEMKKAEPIPF